MAQENPSKIKETTEKVKGFFSGFNWKQNAVTGILAAVVTAGVMYAISSHSSEEVSE